MKWFAAQLPCAGDSNRPKPTGHVPADEALTEENMKGRLQERFATVDFNQVRKDALSFIKN
jgi:hypothetical protein